MKKIYDKPTMILVKMETEHFIAASPVYDQNQVRTDGSGSTGTNVGGTSSKGGSEDNGNGSVADMAKPYNPWTAWDEQEREITSKTKPASMAIESTCVDDRKYLRCHMKPAFFAIESTCNLYQPIWQKRRIAYMIIVICYSLIVFRS